MIISNLLNPQKNLNQFLALSVAFLLGSVGTFVAVEKLRDPCPQITSNSINFEKVKNKGDGTLSIDAMLAPSDGCNCESWYNGLTNKEKRKLKK